MARGDNSTQCELRSGKRRYVAWIPTESAKIGRVVTIDDIDGEWTVHEVYESAKTADMIERSVDYRHQREASDV